MSAQDTGGQRSRDGSRRRWWRVGGAAAAVLGTAFGGALAAAVPAGAVSQQTFFASSSGTGTSCTATNPCTLTKALTHAKSASGTVVVHLASGSYTTQVTITKPNATSFTLQGPTSGAAAVLLPTTLKSNVTEPSNHAFFDDNTGTVEAIIGVHAPSTAVTIDHVTVDGARLASGAKIAGIALVGTSGTISNDTIAHVEVNKYLGNSSDHGIDVNNVSGTSAVSVQVTHTTVDTLGGHVGVDLMGTNAAPLNVTVTGSTLTGTPAATSSPNVAQFGITAGGVKSLDVTGNTISDFQSPWVVGAIWVDPLATGASCSINHNQLLKNDDGVDLRGASGCTVSTNAISAGAAGVEIGPSSPWATPKTASANDNIITGNTITGTATVSSTLTYTPSTTTTPSIAGVPIDGVLMWDGTGTAVTGNTVSGFVSDVFVGEDPVYLDNHAFWGGSLPKTYSGFTTATTAVHNNRLGTLATPAKGSTVMGFGVDHGADTKTYALTAQANWWGSAGGPGAPGVTASTQVNSANWCVTATPCPSAPGAPSNVKAKPGNAGSGKASVTWSAPATDGGSAITGYTVTPVDLTAGTTGTAQSFAATAMSATVTGLTTGHSYKFTVAAINSVGSTPATSTAIVPATAAGATSAPKSGYTMVANDGGIFAFGNHAFHGSEGGKPLNAPIVGIAEDPMGKGYWEVASDGGIFSFGTAPFYGSEGGKMLNAPIVGMAANPNGKGYWEVAADGGIFSFGTAPFYGSEGGKMLNAPIVGMAANPNGKGYWEVAADGGIFSFGTAPFYGSEGGKALNAPIVGMTANPNGMGYWEVASDGGIFAFGTAPFEGSMGGKPLNAPVVGLAS